MHLQLLGAFHVRVDERCIDADAWPTRRASELVQLLALAERHELARDQLIEALWPHLDAEAGAANLRKAAHHARKTLGSAEAVVLRRGRVALFPSAEVTTDVAEFDSAAGTALESEDSEAWRDPVARYSGELLPESRYEDWAEPHRQRLRIRHLDVLRRGGQWQTIVGLEPTDELAHRELMREAMAAGDPHAAVRWYSHLRTALLRELGTRPSSDTDALYDECIGGLGVSEPAFIGRQLELARAEAMLDPDVGDARTAITVRGPAGIGKSALCAQIERRARQRGWLTVHSSARRNAVPYAALVTVVEDLVARDPRLVATLPARTRATVAQVTSLNDSDGTPTRALTRHQVIGALRQVLAAASDTAGVVLVLDDAHAADEATVDAVLQLAGPGNPRIVGVIAYRPEQASEALRARVGARTNTGRIIELDLAALDLEEATALAEAASGPDVDPQRVGWIVDKAGGNPFFILELTQLAAPREPSGMVPSVADTVVARLVDLDETRAAWLRRLAVASDDLDPDTVVALTDASQEEAFDLLDVALTAGILVVDQSRYRFRHDLVRDALVGQLVPHQRVAIHRDTARQLMRSGAAPERIAHHWLEGQRPEDAADWLLAAARRAAQVGAFTDVLRHLRPLLDHRPDHPEALCLRADALDALGEGGAPAAYAAAARIAPDGAEDIRAKQALAQLKLGDFEGALETARDLSPSSLEGRLAQALTLSGVAAIGMGDVEAASRHAATSRRLALELGDPNAVLAAGWAQALAAHARGELRESLRSDVRETAALPELAVAVFDGQLCVTQRLLYGSAPYTDVIAFADALGLEAQRLGAARGHAFARTLRGEAELLSGALAAADHDLIEACALHRATGGSTGEAHALQRRAEVAIHQGRGHDAAELLDQALEVACQSGVEFHLLDRIYGASVSAARDPRHALQVVEDAEEAIRGTVETCPGCRITFAVPAAIASATAGDLDRATRYAKEAEVLAEVVMQLPAWHAAVEEVHGHLSLARGETQQARRHFAAAARAFRDAGQPVDAARCAHSRGTS